MGRRRDSACHNCNSDHCWDLSLACAPTLYHCFPKRQVAIAISTFFWIKIEDSFLSSTSKSCQCSEKSMYCGAEWITVLTAPQLSTLGSRHTWYSITYSTGWLESSQIRMMIHTEGQLAAAAVKGSPVGSQEFHWNFACFPSSWHAGVSSDVNLNILDLANKLKYVLGLIFLCFCLGRKKLFFLNGF